MSRELVFNRAFALLAATKNRIDSHIGTYSDRDDMAGTQLLLETLHKIVEDAQRQIIAIQRELTEGGPAESSQLKRNLLRDARMIARHTAWLTGQPLHYVAKPHGRVLDPIAAAYCRMAREIEPRTELIFRASEHRGYALGQPLLTMLEDNLTNRGSDLIEQVKRLPTFLYVQYPAMAEGDVLQHLLIAHEIAHLLLRAKVRERSTAEDRFEQALLTLKEDDPDSYAAMRAASEKGAKPSEPRNRALRWFTEIACDILAVRLAGPAYYLALCEHALVRQWFYLPSDGETKTHPHLAWRLSRATTQLDGFYSEMKPALQKRVKAVFKPYVEAVPDPSAKIAEEPYGPAIERALDQLVDDLDRGELIEAAALGPSLLAKELPLILERLESGLAPAERILWSVKDVRVWQSDAQDRVPPWSEPLDWRSILNGGYVHLLETAAAADKPLSGSWQAAEQRRLKVVDHLRGSVELSEFQRAARDVYKLRLFETRAAA
jgi:hypothetical protein